MINAIPSWFSGPRVSETKGTKQYGGKMAVGPLYLDVFLLAAISAAAPAASADLR